MSKRTNYLLSWLLIKPGVDQSLVCSLLVTAKKARMNGLLWLICVLVMVLFWIASFSSVCVEADFWDGCCMLFWFPCIPLCETCLIIYSVFHIAFNLSGPKSWRMYCLPTTETRLLVNNWGGFTRSFKVRAYVCRVVLCCLLLLYLKTVIALCCCWRPCGEGMLMHLPCINWLFLRCSVFANILLHVWSVQ